MSSSKFLEFADEDRSASWFDDQIKRVVPVRPTQDGIDTSAIDAYRQGVEITTMSHFAAGTGKISAGEPKHALRTNSFGMTGNRKICKIQEIDELPWFIIGDWLTSDTTQIGRITLKPNVPARVVWRNDITTVISGTGAQQLLYYTYPAAGTYRQTWYVKHPSDVLEFKPYNNSLVGIIPPLKEFTNLKQYDVNSNLLTGEIPELPTSIEYFYCNNNQLSGSIPTLPVSTRVVYCYSNELSGSIPNLSTNVSLSYFYCYSNHISGSIPNLSANVNLMSFYCQLNAITGSIPSLSTNNQLSGFRCHNNQLSGSIPRLPTTMANFNCSANAITGSIPSLSTNVNLTSFACNNNQLSGSIPSLGTQSNLSTFYCQNNAITGSIPNLSANINLINFYCYNNQLSGSIPRLPTSLSQLYCYNNAITGSIPSLSTNTFLKRLYCNNNQLSGSIPSLVANTLLEYFDCSYNAITGSIPSLSANTALKTFSCGNNNITAYTSSSLSTAMSVFNVENNALPEASIDMILANFAASITSRPSSGQILLVSGTNAPPSAAGLASKATILASRPLWTITHN